MSAKTKAGTLWVVATPIGNLEEASPRVARTLAEASAILCEDTRRTRELLSALKLNTDPRRLHRLDVHLARSGTGGDAALGRWLEALRAGEDLALVSDAGTPAVSDPGAELVRAALAEGLQVSPVAGPSALAAFLSVCGFLGNRVVFEGFFPREKAERERLGERLRALPRPALAVFFESPQRVGDALEYVEARASEWGCVRAIAAKELTKRHERVFVGAPAETRAAVDDEISREGALGEWCLALELVASEAAGMSEESTAATDAVWEKALRCALLGGVSPSHSAKIISQEFGVQKKIVYSRAVALDAKIVRGKEE